MTAPVPRLVPVKADGQTCARCGADKAEVRQYRIYCEMPYWRHRWIWKMDE
ncbi:hypothetical protein LCGC14_1711370 [marine sediment metagenome]|uniref:Uncharacterized protein n=1 Tax=marine sediment metagenome TaxID=412755 RepID=A0A0F9HEP9_9ZZZZ